MALYLCLHRYVLSYYVCGCCRRCCCRRYSLVRCSNSLHVQISDIHRKLARKPLKETVFPVRRITDFRDSDFVGTQRYRRHRRRHRSLPSGVLH